jgi:hypothetical protein
MSSKLKKEKSMSLDNISKVVIFFYILVFKGKKPKPEQT